MKKQIFVFLACFFLSVSTFGSIKAYLSYCSFVSTEDGPFLETYLSIYAQSIVFTKLPNGQFQGTVGITMIFRQGEQIQNFKKYELKSPEVADTSLLDFSFIDQQRILLPNGDYEFEIKIQDIHSTDPPLNDIESIKIDYPMTNIHVSGIQLIESYKKAIEPNILTKSGYDFVPYLHNFYPKDLKIIAFYAEVYGADKQLGNESPYLLSYYIQSSETTRPLSEYAKHRKETAKAVSVVLHEFDITKLPSGNYNLVVEARNKENQLIAANSLFFQRSNPDVQLDLQDVAALDIRGSFVENFTNKDSLAEHIRCLAPISSELERVFAENQLRTADLLTMKQYFLHFWMKRDNLYPERSWMVYKEQVEVVHQAYRTPIKKGYETDRGRIYLKYGPPNTIADQPFEASNSGLSMGDGQRDGDMGVVPYQIWHYYQLKNNQRDKKFVFANPNLATNDYALIHSNANGEVNNPNWQSDLVRQIGIYDKDELAPRGRFGNKSGELFNNPR